MSDEDLQQRLRTEQKLAAKAGEAVRQAALALLVWAPNEKDCPKPPKELKTQLSGLLGVTALAQDPREVEVYVRYQTARNKEWREPGSLGDAIAGQCAGNSALRRAFTPSNPGHSNRAAMYGIREFVGQIRRLYTYLAEDKVGGLEERWGHVRRLAQ